MEQPGRASLSVQPFNRQIHIRSLVGNQHRLLIVCSLSRAVACTPSSRRPSRTAAWPISSSTCTGSRRCCPPCAACWATVFTMSQWFRFSDRIVSTDMHNEQTHTQAYLLFYERVTPAQMLTQHTHWERERQREIAVRRVLAQSVHTQENLFPFTASSQLTRTHITTQNLTHPHPHSQTHTHSHSPKTKRSTEIRRHSIDSSSFSPTRKRSLSLTLSPSRAHNSHSLSSERDSHTPIHHTPQRAHSLRLCDFDLPHTTDQKNNAFLERKTDGLQPFEVEKTTALSTEEENAQGKKRRKSLWERAMSAVWRFVGEQ